MRLFRFPFLTLFFIGNLALAESSQVETTKSVDAAATAETQLYPANLIAMSNDPHFSKIAFVVDKTARTLRVYRSEGELPELLEEHPADIGRTNGDKEKANDGKTPVGIYFLMAQKTQPEIPFQIYGSLAFTTDYPNIFDQRVAKGGSGIWLHSVPDKIPLTRGSHGCVVVRNNVIQALKNYVMLGQTPILIAEKIEYLNKADYLAQRKKYLDKFEEWRQAWQYSDIEEYIKFYDPTFHNGHMNHDQWYRHKKKLKGTYKYIKVDLLPPMILRNKDQVVVRTIQNYESDMHTDYGEKTLHAHFSDQQGFKIIREDWQPLKKEPPSDTSADGT